MNCKPGDLALIVSSRFEQNVGVIVDVIGVAHGKIVMPQEPGQIWHCRARGAITYETVFAERIVTSEGPIPDACLRPIRGRGNPEKSTNTRDDLVTSATQQTVFA